MAQPTAQEQQMLELINRMRLAPAAELGLLLNSGDATVANALSFFNVSIGALTQQWGSLLPTAPLAWSSQLSDAALLHNQQMITAGVQSHQLPSEAALNQRVNNAAYTGWNALGENIFAFADSVFYGHAGFAIDWGNGSGGIQSPTGHRDNIMSSNFREIGIGITAATGTVGPLVITEDFGNRSALNGKAWLLGVAFKDLDQDRFYDPGEGLSGITVQVIKSGTTTPIITNTFNAGDYQVLLDPGQYQLNFLQNALLLKSENVSIDATSSVNVKRDLIVTPDNIMTSKPFLVNSFTTNFQNDPSITVLSDGSFVITWSSRGQDAGDNSAYSGIYGQRFSRSGAKIGVEFHVNTGVARDQANSSIAALTDGGFVVVWASNAPDNNFDGIETFQSFKTRSEKNYENRCLHQHVFDTKLAVETVNHHHLQIHAVEVLLPCHIVMVCQKVAHDKILKNDVFLQDNAEYKQLSPFASDKLFQIS